MELRADFQIRTLIKTMTDVVLPALAPEDALAREQGRLVVGMLQLMAERLPLQFRHDLDELESWLASVGQMLDRLEGGGKTRAAVEDVRTASSEGARIVERARAEPAELESALFRLRAKLGALVQAVAADGGPEARESVERVLLGAAKEQVRRERAWVMGMGFDDPASVPPLDDLLRGPDRGMPERDDKDRPSAEWIESLRRRFPCEPQVDRLLTRKLARRAGPGYSPVGLEALTEGAQALVRANLDDAFELSKPRWLTGGASKVQMAFELTWTRPGLGRTTTPMVLRMQPAESIVETSRMREFQLMKAFEGVVPVPPVFWVDETGEFLPYPAMITEFRPGVARPSQGSGGISGLGTNFGPVARVPLGKQFVQHLAAIHTRDWSRAGLTAFDVPEPGAQAALWQVDWWERVWEEDAHEDVPLMRLAASWMRANLPRADSISVVHGDYRTGNFLYTEEDDRISAILDWELGHLGDRHEDLAWALKPSFGHLAEDGETFLVGGFMPRSRFLDLYRELSGFEVDGETLDFYDVLNAYKNVVIVLATGWRVAHGGKGHQDVTLAYLVGVAYKMLEELRVLLHERTRS